MSSEFEALANQLETLAKSQGSSEDDKVLAAAKEAGVDVGGDGDGDEGAGASGSGVDGDGDGDDMLGKSFDVVDAEGKPAKAYDATALLKSMGERIEALEGGIADVAERREHLGKSLGLIAELLEANASTIKAQGEQIADMRKSLDALGAKGTGRKAVLTINERPEPLGKSVQANTLSREEFLAKADGAQKAGRLLVGDMPRMEAYLNKGMPVPADIVSRVMGNA